MDLEFLKLGGHGQFVWPAFMFAFLSCLILYFRTRNELKKVEKIFLIECEQLHKEQTRVAKPKKITKEVLSASTL